MLTHFNPNKKIVVSADASNHCMGAVILHIFSDGIEKVIIHAARSLVPAKRNYSYVEKEAPVLIFAVKKFQKVLFSVTLHF